MAEYRAAIVGLTGIATNPAPVAPHPVLGTEMPASHAAAYAALPQTTVVAVCDLVPELIERFRQTWGERFPHITGYTDYREMLEREQVDILSVVTSDHRHADIVVDACAAGVKAIFCEKPIATTLADADRMVEAAERHGVKMSVDHTRRWRPEWQKARQLLRDGAIGTLTRAVASLGGPRAMLFRNGTHLIDALNFFVDARPAWLTGALATEFRGYGPRYAGDGGRDPATDPSGSAYLEYENGVGAFIAVVRHTMSPFELDLHGSEGRMVVRDGSLELWTGGDRRRLQYQAVPVPQVTRGALVAGIAELIALIERGGESVSPPRAARQALEIILAILQSQAQGNTRITFPIADV